MSFTVGVCDFCPAPVIWADTGKARMPVNPQPDVRGNVVLIGRAVGAPHAVVTSRARDHPGQPRYLPHFADCPGADTARKPRTAPPAQTETLF